MIKLKAILMEHPEVDIDINTTLPNKCATPGQKSSIQNSLDRAVDYWKKRINDPVWQQHFIIANELESGKEFLHQSTLITPAQLFKQYTDALKKVSLVVLETKDVESLARPPAINFIAFVKSVWKGHPEFGKVYARCELAWQSENGQIATMIHEIAHVLFQVKPFNDFSKWKKTLFNLNRVPRTQRVDFDERESLIRRRLQADPDMAKVNKVALDEFLEMFFERSRSNADRQYYCSETEKQSNLAVLNYALGRQQWTQIWPETIVDLFNNVRGGLAWVDASDTSKKSAGASNVALLLDCWISSLGMKYEGDAIGEIGNKWPTLKDFCHELSQLVAKLKTDDSTTDITPDQRT